MLTITDFSIKHSIPGRIRIAFPALVSRKNLTRRFESYFSDTPGINDVRSTHFCGSITIQYNSEIFNKERILALIKGFHWDDPIPAHAQSSKVQDHSPIPHHPPLLHDGKIRRFRTLWNVAGSISIGIRFGSVGPLIDNFRKGKGLPAKMKSRSILFMWVSMATSMIFFVESNTLRAAMVLVGIGVTLYIFQIKTSKPIAHFSARKRIPEKIDPIKSE